VDIDLPQPRTVETREQDRYFELVTEVREVLRRREDAAGPDDDEPAAPVAADADRIRAEGLA
jgi:hypothetical protein